MVANDDADGRYRRGFEALLAVSRAIASPCSQHELVDRILEIVARAFGTSDSEPTVCSLRLLDASTGELHLTASHGMRGKSRPLRLGESVVGQAVLERGPRSVPDLENSSCKMSDFVKERGFKSIVSVPLLLRDRSLGGLTVYGKATNAFSDEDVTLLSAITASLAAVVENDLLLGDTLTTLMNLALAVESKEPFSQGHSERVTAYALRLGERVGIDSEDLKVLERMGPMHDIGKAGISETILNKPARLSPHERKAVERHPVIGEHVVSSIRSFQSGLFLIRHHHERLDGRGYPDGLQGLEIPLAVRILSIADAFDAMTTKRPFRDRLDTDAAAEELRAEAGRQFDPRLVDAFCDMVAEDGYPAR
jgi:HD-GYP domain-containing protein (c-di-GMP phosphodiesterase class II)